MKHALKALLVLALAACSPPAAQAPEGSADPTAAQTSDAAPAGGEEAINAWFRERHGADLFDPVSIEWGDFDGDGAADALGWGYYAMGGTSAGTTIALFRNDNGIMTFVRTADDVYGQEPRDIVIAPGQITLTTSVPRDGDPHCCPTGSQDWTIETD